MLESLISAYQPMADSLGIPVIYAAIMFAALSVWETVWKFLGMWKSAQKKSIWWFVCIGIFNTIGILPILYIYVFSKRNEKRKK